MVVYVYAIKSTCGERIYVGQTSDVEKRLKQHNSGSTRSTRYYRPWELFYSKLCPNRRIARQLEKHLKSGCGKEFLKANLCARSSIG